MFAAVSMGVTSLVLATSAVVPSPASRAASAQTVMIRFASLCLTHVIVPRPLSTWRTNLPRFNSTVRDLVRHELCFDAFCFNFLPFHAFLWS